MKVTHTLPEASYPAYLRFAAVCRYIGQVRTKIDPALAEEMLIVGMLEISEAAVSEKFENLELFAAEIIRALTEPTEPETFLIATFMRFSEMLKEPTTDDEFARCMRVIISIIAISYDKPQRTVMTDMMDEFDYFDKMYNDSQLAKVKQLLHAVSPSGEFH